MAGLVQLVTSLPSREAALELAHAAVEAGMAACVQVLGPVTSVYRWQGAVQEDQEHLCVIKVPEAGLDAAVAFVRARHPYDTPELTAVGSAFVDARYLAWAEEVTAASGASRKE
jgi:periplasmic divalent cation tolerance protein